MKSPTVSVVMPTYNHAGFVRQSIESVLAQQGVDFELLIADDGSSDNTREVVGSIEDRRIQFFAHTINRGACVVTNGLIQRATGEFIALINSDDYWTDSDKLAYQVKILREKPDVGACFGRARFVDKVGLHIDKATLPFGTVFDQPNRSQGEWLRYFFDHGNCICHPTVLIRRACYQELGMYNNRLRQLPDFDMWIRLIKKYPIHISERELVNFRILPGENASSQTGANTTRSINEHMLIAEGFFENIRRDQIIEGFSDILILSDIPTEEHLDIEKYLFFFVENQWLGKPYKLIGLLKFYKLLGDPKYQQLMTDSYGLDDIWFHKKMGEVTTLRPKVIEEVGEASRMLIRAMNRLAGLFRQSSNR
jgi:glycosyltransferase involved in cell wall biosynthesis